MMRLVFTVVIAVASGCNNSDDDRLIGEGGVCEELADCANNLVCGHEGICLPIGAPGTLAEGQPCVGSAECRLGLACSTDALCTVEGEPGTVAFGETCATTADCAFGLSCAEDLTCRGLELKLWRGFECPAEEEGPFRVHFEVPGTEPLADFYRLPFPNDARVSEAGRIDLSGHPSPGALIDLVGDAVGNLIRVVEEDLEGGFGPNQAVFFRFSEFPDPARLSFGIPGQGTLALVDLTPEAPEDGFVPFRYEVRSSASPYICDNWLAMHAINGRPLEPGRTYAAILSRSIENKGTDSEPGGDDLVQDPDFTAVLSATAPTDLRLSRAWGAYAPLRDWLVAKSIDPADVGAAAVFTVQDPTERPRLVHEAVEALAAPTLGSAVVCGEGDPFAVSGDEARGCTEADPRWTEIQGLVGLPQFQGGTPPFKDFGDGGAIDTSQGAPAPQRTEDVHVAMSIPKGAAMPAAGWPVVLYAHGTGGSYTSFLREGLAERFTEVQRGPDTVRFAMVGFDAPLHGPRNHPENHDSAWLDVDPNAYDPDVLFFNPLNVRAARDNGLQQAADTWALVRWLATVDLDADSSPTGAPLRFDVDHIYYMGHSQGGVVGALAVAWEPEIDGVVLSGAGGLFIESLLGKTSPNNLLQGVRVGLADALVTRTHPILNLAQQVAEGTDGVNHARYVARSPPEGSTSRDVLQIYGVGDTYTPDATQYTLARTLGLQQAPNGQTPLQTIGEVTLPTTGNLFTGATGVVVLYPPATGSDAHFVLFDREDAPTQVAGFLASGVLEGTPTVDAPAP